MTQTQSTVSVEQMVSYPPYLHVCSFSILTLNNLNDFMPQILFHNQ